MTEVLGDSIEASEDRRQAAGRCLLYIVYETDIG